MQVEEEVIREASGLGSGWRGAQSLLVEREEVERRDEDEWKSEWTLEERSHRLNSLVEMGQMEVKVM